MPSELESCPKCGALPCDWTDNPHEPATPAGDDADLLDEIAEAISDTLDMDWQPSWAAPNILALINRERAAAHAAGRAENYKTFTDGMEAAAQICGSLAETTYDDADAFEAATGCEAAIMRVVREQRKEQSDAIERGQHGSKGDG